MSDKRERRWHFLEYLSIGVIAFLSIVFVLELIRGERTDLVFLVVVGGLGIIAVVVWVILRTSSRRPS